MQVRFTQMVTARNRFLPKVDLGHPQLTNDMLVHFVSALIFFTYSLLYPPDTVSANLHHQMLMKFKQFLLSYLVYFGFR